MPQQAAAYTIGKPLIELSSVDSTNNYAMGLVHAGMAQAGTAILAYEQTSGRGQRGKAWIAPKNQNINLSIIIAPSSLQAADLFSLTAAVATGVHTLIASYTGPDETTVKWPNDIYWRDRKAAGILVENVWGAADTRVSGLKWSVIGIGINVNTPAFPEHLPNPVSLKQVTGKSFDIRELTLELCTVLNNCIPRQWSGNQQAILHQYNQLLYKKNQLVKLKKENRIFEGEIAGVLPNGQLHVRHALDEYFSFGELVWL